jgi:hypothetical protein
MNHIRSLFLVIALLSSSGTATAQEFLTNKPATTATSGFDEILLKDGNLLQGKIIEERVDLVIFATESLGRLEIPRDNIRNIAHHGTSEGVIADPDQNSIMFCPTPASLPKGDSYFRDFELFVLNFGFGVTDNFDLSFGTFFPVSSDFIMFTGGAKWRLMDRDVQPVGLALTGSYTLLDDLYFGAVGAVVGIGNARKSLNLAINYAFADGGDSEIVYILGGDIQISRRSKLFAEFFSSSALIENDDIDGFINIGFRIFSKKHSFSLSGFRPLTNYSNGLYALPMLSYSVHW